MHATPSSPTPSLTCFRIGKPFVPPSITLREIHAAVPKHLLRKDARLSAYYCVRDVACCAAIFYYGFHIEHILANIPLGAEVLVKLARAALWLVYWFFQGLSFASFFCIGSSRSLGHHTSSDTQYPQRMKYVTSVRSLPNHRLIDGTWHGSSATRRCLTTDT